MLLTSGQISMGISSIIVFTFSTLLFLSGYILQQRTVRDIQEILTSASGAISPPVQNITEALDAYPWDKAAYVQILSQYSDVCGAGMTFAELARQGSRARRVLVYPKEWEEGVKPEMKGRDRSLRLLRRVVVRYGIGLKGVDIHGDGAGALRMGDVEKMVVLRGAGVVYNASRLDGLFLEGERYFVGEGGDVIAAVVEAGGNVKIETRGVRLDELLKSTGLEERYDRLLFGETRALKNAVAEDDGDEAELRAAYMRVSDPGILGPEYDIPQSIWEQARPDGSRTKRVWENIYADYRTQRMAVCGLEVEPLPQTTTLDGVDL